MLYKVFQLLSLDETLVCDHPNESYWAALSCSLMWNRLLYRVIFTFVYEIPVCQEPINQHSVFLKTEFYSWYRRLSRYNYKISPAGTGIYGCRVANFFMLHNGLLMLRKAEYCFRKSKLFPVMLGSHGD